MTRSAPPIRFEPNRGQTDPSVRFVARGGGYSLFLTDTETVLTVRDAAEREPRFRRGGGELYRAPARRAVLRARLVGGRASRVVGVNPLPGRSHYLQGRDPARWRRDVPHFAGVRCEQVYPGIDLEYYGTRDRLEYDFTVRPGGDPRHVTMRFDGASALGIDPSGDLRVGTPAGDVRHQRPVAYQEVDGARREVACRFVLRDERSAGFEVAAYDATRPLVIDPVLTWASFLGGTGEDEGNDIALDEERNPYVIGTTDSLDFPATAGVFQGAGAGETDAFVTRMTSDGTAIVFSTYLGGSRSDWGLGIAVDSGGRAFLTGRTASLDFPIASPHNAQPAQPQHAGGPSDAFVTKLTADGSAIVYSTYLGGTVGEDFGNAIAVDSTGNAYITGATGALTFPLVRPVQVLPGGGPLDAFVTKLGPLGEFDYSTYLGGGPYNYFGGTDFGRGVDIGYGIAVDAEGSAYVAGSTSSRNFRTLNPFQRVNRTLDSNESDAFVAKFASGGQKLIYSSYLGGAADDCALDIDVDSGGNAYLTGYTRSNNFPTGKLSNPIYGTRLGGSDAFVTKVDAGGFRLIFSTYYGGRDNDEGRGIAVDRGGNVYVTGRTSSVDFPVTRPLQGTFGGLFDAFIAKFDTLGRRAIYSAYFGSNDQDSGNRVALDKKGSAYIVGTTLAPSFPSTAGVFQGAYGGGISDAFVARVDDEEPDRAEPGGRIRIPRSLKFGRVPVGATVTRTLRVTNVGRLPLTGTIETPVAPYAVAEGGGPFFLERRQSVEVTVRFRPDQPGSNQEFLTVRCSDPRRPAVRVLLSGNGR